MLRMAYVNPEHRRKGLMSLFIAERCKLAIADMGVTTDWRVCLPMTRGMRALVARMPRRIWPTNIDVPDLYPTDDERAAHPVYRQPWWGLPVSERVPAFLEAWRAGELSRDDARTQWLHLWVECIDDDSAALWREVWVSIADGRMVTDASPEDLPETDYLDRLLIHRGELSDAGEPVGMAWSTNPAIAADFAVLYDSARSPTVWTGYVHARDVLAYITHVGESEVIADPAKVVIVEKRRLPWVSLSPYAMSREVRLHQGQLAELSSRS